MNKIPDPKHTSFKHRGVRRWGFAAAAMLVLSVVSAPRTEAMPLLNHAAAPAENHAPEGLIEVRGGHGGGGHGGGHAHGGGGGGHAAFRGGGGGFRAAHVFRGGGYRGGYRRHYGGGYYGGPVYDDYYYPRRCRVILTYYGPRRVCHVRHWRRPYYRHHYRHHYRHYFGFRFGW